jgi:hypothetical protein
MNVRDPSSKILTLQKKSRMTLRTKKKEEMNRGQRLLLPTRKPLKVE